MVEKGKIMNFLKKGLSLALALSVAIFTGCEDGGGDGASSGDIGDNNPGLIVCIGDSITYGYLCDGAPYPSQLANITGKSVRNGAVCGATSDRGISAARAALQTKPAYLCILYGSNDAIHQRPIEDLKAHIATIINLAKNNKTIPIVGTPPKQIGEHSLFDPLCQQMGQAIKEVCSSMGVACVDLYSAFGNGTSYLVSDGLHPNAAGSLLIAQKFAAKIK